MDDRLSSDLFDEPVRAGVEWCRGGGRPVCTVLGGLLGGLPRLLAAAPGPDLGWHCPAFGDDRLGLRGSDGMAVGVADGIRGAAAHDGPGPFGEAGGDDA